MTESLLSESLTPELTAMEVPQIDILWKLVDGVGLEHCRMHLDPDGPSISGTVVTVVEGSPATIRYEVQCDRYWHTREVVIELLTSAEVESTRLHLLSDGDGNWQRITETDERQVRTNLPQIAGCIDIDLSFTPATNTIPLRRYTLVHGARVKVTAAWVQFPSLLLEPLPQQYTRLEKPYYRYQSFRDGFTTDLEVDEHGIVTTYPGLWERLTATAQTV